MKTEEKTYEVRAVITTRSDSIKDLERSIICALSRSPNVRSVVDVSVLKVLQIGDPGLLSIAKQIAAEAKP